MHAMASRSYDDAIEIVDAPEPRRAVAVPAAPVAAPGCYHAASRGPNWGVIGMIAGLHAAALAALVLLDVVPVTILKTEPTLVLLEPEPITPPPPAPPAPPVEQVADRPIVTPVVSPPPIVKIAAPTPPPIASVPVPPPPQPTAAVPSEAAAPAPPAPPVSAPDASSATLGNPPPSYPREARKRRLEGTVRLRVIITPDGRVKEISVARSSGHDVLDDAALTVVRKWKFKPGLQAGVPVEAVGYLNIPFKIRD